MKIKLILSTIFMLLLANCAFAANTYYVPVFKPQTQYWSGLGITNLSSTSKANIVMTVYGQNGETLTSETKSIAAGGQDTFLCGKSLASDGWIKISSDQALAGLNFLGKYDESEVNYYLSDVPFIKTLSSSLIIPHVAQNSSWDTTIFLVNPNTSSANVSLTYANKNGTQSTPYVVSVLANGGKEVSVASITGSNSIKGGYVIISSSQDLAAFAIFSNLKTGNYGYTGIAAESFSLIKNSTYPIVDTGQTICYDAQDVISCPDYGETFYGQDSQFNQNKSSYTNNGDGTITDNITGLMWQQSPDTNSDGDIDAKDKLAYNEAVAGAATLTLGGYSDWRLPTIKELYSLIDFQGVDPSGYEGSDTSGMIPFIDTVYFDFAYGDTNSGERIIDSQYASSNLYVDKGAGSLLFGVNFADGRIKGYGLSMPWGEKTFFVIYVRGNTNYGQNKFDDNSDGTISDSATGLMWSQNDSTEGLNWEMALAWVQEKNNRKFLGYSDWRLPNVKELQSIVDYTRSPGTTNSAAIDLVFNATTIINEAGQDDYPFYWSSTTHSNWTDQPGSHGAYVAFGRSLGYMDDAWTDVHGAGSQRSDPKAGDPADYPTGFGPQGDAIRIYNYVRLVRNINN